MKLKRIFLTFAFILVLNGCSSNANNKKLGQILGSTVGAVVGSEFGSGSGKAIMTILGAATGYLIGGEIVEILTKDEQEQLNEEIINSLETSPPEEKNVWRSNEDNSTVAEIVPGEKFFNNNKTCRSYKKTVVKNEKKYLTDATACRNQEGNWVLL